MKTLLNMVLKIFVFNYENFIKYGVKNIFTLIMKIIKTRH